MLTLRLDVNDLASVRFGYSPMQEAVLSMWALRHPERHPLHRRWCAAAAPLLDRFDWPLLDSLEGPHGWIPDFLTPYPESTVPAFADELEAVRRTQPDRVRRDIEAAHRGPDRRPRRLPDQLQALERDPRSVRDGMVDALRCYWDLLVAPHWPRIRDVLDSDIEHRARSLAAVGAGELFQSLGSSLRWQDGRLELDAHGLDADTDMDGRGLMVTPSVFANSVNSMIDERLPPVLCYPARGRARLWSAVGPAGPGLAALLGATRAALLLELDAPATTSQLALRLNLSPGGVSQHLKVLHESDLLGRTRAGRVVLYQRSALGQQLVDVHGRRPPTPA